MQYDVYFEGVLTKVRSATEKEVTTFLASFECAGVNEIDLVGDYRSKGGRLIYVTKSE